MSYDISLCEPVIKKVIQFDASHHIKGRTYQFGGSTKAYLNVTYNYSEIFYKYFGEKGIRTIYGMTGAESILLFKNVINILKDDETEDYWEPTEGNAKKALYGLLAFAQLRPDGIWEGD